MKTHRNDMWPKKATFNRKIHEFDHRKVSIDHSLGDAALVSEFYKKVSHLSVLRRCSHTEGTRLKSRAKYRLPWQVISWFLSALPTTLNSSNHCSIFFLVHYSAAILLPRDTDSIVK
jgi:hypothetical protein